MDKQDKPKLVKSLQDILLVQANHSRLIDELMAKAEHDRYGEDITELKAELKVVKDILAELTAKKKVL